jgi:hypothetical protein
VEILLKRNGQATTEPFTVAEESQSNDPGPSTT